MEIQTFILPAHWASYLIDRTGDYSLEPGDTILINAFLRNCKLTDWDCVDVSDEVWFARQNDATGLGGNVATFTFIKS